MTNNYILRKLQYALNIDALTIMQLFEMSGHVMEPSTLQHLLKEDGEKGFVECSDTVLESFLDGLIYYRRGKREIKPGLEKKPVMPLTNNAILKKLRIALELNEEDMIAILKTASVNISKSELTALFRREGHKNYKECGDQFLRNFLKGLTIRYKSKSGS